MLLLDKSCSIYRKKRLWMRRLISRRQEMGVYNTLMKELEYESDKEFQSFARVPPDLYHEIVRRLGQGFRNNTHSLGKLCHLVSSWPSPSGSLALVYLTTAWPMSSDVLTIPSAWSSLRLVRPSLLNTWRSRLNVQKHQRSGKEWHEAFQRDGTYTTFVGH